MCDFLKSVPTDVISGAVRHIATKRQSNDGVDEQVVEI